jgi:PAS domain S-box-containing protein
MEHPAFRAAAAAAVQPEHVVQFFPDDGTLLESLSAFVSSALADGSAVIAIATREHLEGLLPRLRTRYVGLDAALAEGRYVALDAHDTLQRILVDGRPDAAAFESQVASIIEATSRRHGHVAAFGEMVGVLWRGGAYGAAVELEALWNRLRTRIPFALFCAYPQIDLGDHASAALRNVSLAHTRDATPCAHPTAEARVTARLRQLSDRLASELEHRRSMERTLAAREHELADLLNNAALGAHTVGPDGVIQWANRYELEMLGYAAEEYIGHSVVEFHADAAEGRRILARLHAGETLRDEPARLRCRDGSVRDVLITSNVQWDEGRFVRTRCFTRDVTEQRNTRLRLEQVESRATEARALLAAIVASSDDAIVSKSLQGRITSWNEGAERIFGYPAAEAVGRPITMIIPPELHDEERHILAKLTRGERIDHFETVRVRKDGCRVDVSLTISPVRDAEGRIVGASKIARDVTESKRLEAKLREADQRKNEFLAMLGHELRNPLASIRNISEVLLRTSRDNGGQHQLCTMLERQVQHMGRLLDDLLDVSRIVQGKIKFERKPIDLADVVRQAVETARPLIDERRHRLDVRIEAAPLPIRGDAARLVQMLGNLLNNAAKYTPPGGEVRVSAQRRDDSIEARVADNGAGIAADRQERIFDLFFQDERTVEQSQNGLGIGLTLVRSIVEHHGGDVAVRSDGVGQGSEFVVTLPLDRSARRTVSNADIDAHGAPAAEAGKRILIVDDNVDASASLAILLRLKGHDVAVASDGPSALDLVQQSPPDLALLDIGMPGMDGYEIARRLRERGYAKRLVAVTGYGTPEDRERSRRAGFDHHFVKPIDPAALEQFIAASADTKAHGLPAG